MIHSLSIAICSKSIYYFLSLFSWQITKFYSHIYLAQFCMRRRSRGGETRSLRSGRRGWKQRWMICRWSWVKGQGAENRPLDNVSQNSFPSFQLSNKYSAVFQNCLLQQPSITIVEGDYHYHVDGKRFISSFILLFWQTTSILPHLYITSYINCYYINEYKFLLIQRERMRMLLSLTDSLASSVILLWNTC